MDIWTTPIAFLQIAVAGPIGPRYLCQSVQTIVYQL